MNPKVAVIIPAYNEEDVIRDCLEGLKEQTYSNFKAHIIDDQSSDSTASIIREYAEKFPDRFELKQYGKVGPGRARNIVAKEVSAEILAFTDADAKPSPRWLEELLRGFERSDVGSVGGPQFAMPNSNSFQRRLESIFSKFRFFIDFHKGTFSKEIFETAHNPLCNVSYRRKLFEELKGFREDLFPGEDVEIDLRVKSKGYKILYNPEAIVHHHRPENIQRFRKVMFAYGRAQGELVRLHGFKRMIQWFGLFALILPIGALIALGVLQFFLPTIVLLGALTIAWSYRPTTETYWSIFWNGLDWFKGFATGLRKNLSR